MTFTYPLILDGATGTELQKRGFTGNISTEEWVLAHPGTLTEIQRAYVEAGSRIVMAPTFGANGICLEKHGLADRTKELNAAMTELSKKAVDGRALVGGDLGPTGKFPAPFGDATFEELYTAYLAQAEALEAAGADLFCVETSMSLADARAAVLAVKAVSDKPVFVSFTVGQNGRTLTGADPAAALVTLQAMGIDAFGLNCSVGPKEMLPVLQRLRAYAGIPLIAKPNAGLPEFIDGKAHYNCSPEEFASYVPDFAAAGVKIFGGCCGTDAGHIAALKQALEAIGPLPVIPEPAGESCANERAVFPVPDASEFGEALPCDNTLEDALTELDGEPASVALNAESGLPVLADALAMLSAPLRLVCNDAALLEQALRLYQGRAVYGGSLTAEELSPLVSRYGLICP